MRSPDVLPIVREAVGIVMEVDPGSVTPSSSLAALGVDSLARVSIADIVEERLRVDHGRDVHIDDASLGAMTVVGDIADYAASRPAVPA